jgi:signal peptidase II
MMRLGLSVALAAAAVDQIVKSAMVEFIMNPPRVIELLPVLNLVLVHNRGASFGILNIAAQWVPFLLTGVAAAVVVMLVAWLRKAENRTLAAAIGLIIGGAIGNSVDRMLRATNAVVDYIDFYVGPYHWPAFNLADTAIVTGAVILLIDSLLNRR